MTNPAVQLTFSEKESLFRILSQVNTLLSSSDALSPQQIILLDNLLSTMPRLLPTISVLDRAQLQSMKTKIDIFYNLSTK